MASVPYETPPRETARASQEYDQSNWNRVLAERAWERAASLEEFLVGDDQRERFEPRPVAPGRPA